MPSIPGSGGAGGAPGTPSGPAIGGGGIGDIGPAGGAGIVGACGDAIGCATGDVYGGGGGKLADDADVGGNVGGGICCPDADAEPLSDGCASCLYCTGAAARRAIKERSTGATGLIEDPGIDDDAVGMFS